MPFRARVGDQPRTAQRGRRTAVAGAEPVDAHRHGRGLHRHARRLRGCTPFRRPGPAVPPQLLGDQRQRSGGGGDLPSPRRDPPRHRARRRPHPDPHPATDLRWPPRPVPAARRWVAHRNPPSTDPPSVRRLELSAARRRRTHPAPPHVGVRRCRHPRRRRRGLRRSRARTAGHPRRPHRPHRQVTRRRRRRRPGGPLPPPRNDPPIRRRPARRVRRQGSRERRHRDYFLTLAEHIEPRLFGEDQDQATTELLDAQPNLAAALDWSENHGDTEAMLRFVCATFYYFIVRGMVAQGRTWAEASLAPGDGDPRLRPRPRRPRSPRDLRQ